MKNKYSVPLKQEFRRIWDYHRANNFASLSEEEAAKLKDDVRLFRFREEAITEQCKKWPFKPPKPPTKEETEKMWREVRRR